MNIYFCRIIDIVVFEIKYINLLKNKLRNLVNIKTYVGDFM